MDFERRYNTALGAGAPLEASKQQLLLRTKQGARWLLFSARQSERWTTASRVVTVL